MATIDLPAVQAHFEDQHRIVLKRLAGAANHKRFIGLTEEEHANIELLSARYEQWQAVLERLLIDFAALLALGPTLPTMDVPNSMIDSLHREAAENEEFRSLFETGPVASALGAKVFGNPEPQ